MDGDVCRREILQGLNGENVWGGCREETLRASKEFVVSIKGPLTTPVGGGIRSINDVAPGLDLYVCIVPCATFKGVPQPAETTPRKPTW